MAKFFLTNIINFMTPESSSQSEVIPETIDGSQIIKNFHERDRGYPNIKRTMVGLMIASGALVAGVGTTYVLSPLILERLSKIGIVNVDDLNIEQLIIDPQILPSVPTSITPANVDPSIMEEINSMIQSDPGLQRMISSGRYPVTGELLPIDPDIVGPDPIICPPGPDPIDPDITIDTLDKNFEFLKDPKIMGAIGGGIAGVALAALIVFLVVRYREKNQAMESQKDAMAFAEAFEKYNDKTYNDKYDGLKVNAEGTALEIDFERMMALREKIKDDVDRDQRFKDDAKKKSEVEKRYGELNKELYKNLTSLSAEKDVVGKFKGAVEKFELVRILKDQTFLGIDEKVNVKYPNGDFKPYMKEKNAVDRLTAIKAEYEKLTSELKDLMNAEKGDATKTVARKSFEEKLATIQEDMSITFKQIADTMQPEHYKKNVKSDSYNKHEDLVNKLNSKKIAKSVIDGFLEEDVKQEVKGEETLGEKIKSGVLKLTAKVGIGGNKDKSPAA